VIQKTKQRAHLQRFFKRHTLSLSISTIISTTTSATATSRRKGGCSSPNNNGKSAAQTTVGGLTTSGYRQAIKFIKNPFIFNPFMPWLLA